MNNNYKNISPEYQKYLCKHTRAYLDSGDFPLGSPRTDQYVRAHFMNIPIGPHSDVDGERVCVEVSVPVAEIHFTNKETISAHFRDRAECDEFLDHLFTNSYGFFEINKKLYVNVGRINYVTFEE